MGNESLPPINEDEPPLVAVKEFSDKEIEDERKAIDEAKERHPSHVSRPENDDSKTEE